MTPNEIIYFVGYLEDYIEAKVETILKPHSNHATLNKRRTAMIDYLEELIVEDEEEPQDE